MSRPIVAATFVALLLVFALGSCGIAGVDIRDRLAMFATTLNSTDRSAINANFDQARTQYLPLMNSAFWNTNFPAPPDSDHLYGITLLDYSNPSQVVATIMGPPGFNLNTGVPRNAVFVMSKEGLDWFIQQLYLDGSSTALIK
jgi:hypothetical protein